MSSRSHKDVVPFERPATKTIGIWIRVSTEDQAKGESPEHHEIRARMYATARGWTVLRVYNLAGYSGKTVKEHPEAKAMLRDVANGRITGLIFSKIARLARNTRELLEFADYFREHGADLVSLQESIDTSTPSGRLFYTFVAGMAQWEREEIADRVAASVKVRATLGKPLGGAAPFGYRWVDKRLQPDPDEAPVVRRMFELFREHKRMKAVAEILNEAGYRTRNGSRFSDTTVRRLLSDPIMKGRRRANHTKSTGEGKGWVPKQRDEWIFSEVEPIVSEEMWSTCEAFIAERAAGRKPAKRVAQLFSGVAFCHCGRKMYVPSNTPKYVCYACRTKIPVADLERIFQSELAGFFFSPDEVGRYLAEGDRVLAEKRELLAAAERELATVRAEMDKLYRLYIDDQLTPAGFGDRNRPLEERRLALEAEIPRLSGEIDFMHIKHLSSAEVVATGQDLASRWTELPFEERRAIVETIVERVTIGESEVTFDLGYSPTPAPPPASPPETPAKRQHGHRGSSPRGV